MEKLNGKAKGYIRSHIRMAWRYYSDARKKCLLSKTCVGCKKKPKKLFADHILPVGSFKAEENPYIQRMFSGLENLQALCAECHNKKTKEDRVK